MSLPTEASTTWIKAIPRAAAAKSDKPKHSDPPVPIALEATSIAAPATTALAAPASPAVPASPASAGTVLPASSNPAAAQAASTPAASVEQSPSIVSSKALESVPAPAPTNESTLESAVSASQVAPSGATATQSSPTPSEGPLDASSTAAQGGIAITSTSHSRIPTSTIALPSLTQASGESPANSLAVAPASTPSTPHINLASVIGGVVGGLAFVGIFLFLWWQCNRRKGLRSSLLPPPNTQFERNGQSEKDESDDGSLGPMPCFARWKAHAGQIYPTLRMSLENYLSSFKAKLDANSSDPSVNINKGNLQFPEPNSQHSHSDSAMTERRNNAPTNRDRFGGGFENFTEDINFDLPLSKKGKYPVDQRTATRSMSEKQAGSNQMARDLSQILAMKDSELRPIVDPRRRSLSAPVTGPRSLVLDFSDTSNPFADPPSTSQQIILNPSKPPARIVLDPFADPVDLMSSFNSYQRTSSDGARILRSRDQAQSIHTYSAPTTPSRSSISTNPTNRGSRYSFMIRSSQDSYPDSVISALSISSRTTRARSDPFDLERLRLWAPPSPVSSQTQTEGKSTVPRINTVGGSQWGEQPRVETVKFSMPRIRRAGCLETGFDGRGECAVGGENLGEAVGMAL